MALKLEIVTPEHTAYTQTGITSVLLPTQAGELGVLPGHVPLVTLIQPGEIAVQKTGSTDYLAVDKGFAQIIGNTISVLTEGAMDVAQIDLDAVQTAREAAEKELAAAQSNEDFDPIEMERLEKVARFAMAQEMAKAKRR